MKSRTFVFLLIVLPFQLFSQNQEIDLLILNNENQQALQMIDSKLNEDNQQPTLWLKKGIVLQKTFNYTEAIKALKTAYELDSANVNILNELAETNNALGNYEDAVSYFEKAYHRNPEDGVIAGKLSRAYLNTKVYDKPYKILSEIYQKDSTNVYFNKQLAFAAYNIGADSLAITLYHKVIAQNPRDISSYFNLNTILQKKEKLEEALAVLDSGLAVFPENPSLLLKMANSSFEMKKYPEAADAYELYLQKNDTLPDIRKSLGIAYFFMKRETEALKLLEKYFELVPTDPMGSFYIGLCYKNLADYKQSIDFIEFAIELSRPPYLADIYHHLGLVYDQNRDFKEAIEALQKAYELDSTNNLVLFEIATTYEEFHKDKTLAINYYKAFLESAEHGGAISQDLMNYAMARIRKFEEDRFFEGIKKP